MYSKIQNTSISYSAPYKKQKIFHENYVSEHKEESKNDDTDQTTVSPTSESTQIRPYLKINANFFKFSHSEERENLINFAIYSKHQLINLSESQYQNEVTNLINQTIIQLEQSVKNGDFDFNFYNQCRTKLVEDLSTYFDTEDDLTQLSIEDLIKSTIAIYASCHEDIENVILSTVNTSTLNIDSEYIDIKLVNKNLDNFKYVIEFNTNKIYYEDNEIKIERKYDTTKSKKIYCINNNMIAYQSIKQVDLSHDSLTKKHEVGNGGYGKVISTTDNNAVKKFYTRGINNTIKHVTLTNKLSMFLIQNNMQHFLPIMAIPSQKHTKEVMPHLEITYQIESFKVLSLNQYRNGVAIPKTTIAEIFEEIKILNNNGFSIVDVSPFNVFIGGLRNNQFHRITIIDYNGALANDGYKKIEYNGQLLYFPTGPLNYLCTLWEKNIFDKKYESNLMQRMLTIDKFYTEDEAKSRTQLFGYISTIATCIMITSGFTTWISITNEILPKCNNLNELQQNEVLHETLNKISATEDQLTEHIEIIWQVYSILDKTRRKLLSDINKEALKNEMIKAIQATKVNHADLLDELNNP